MCAVKSQLRSSAAVQLSQYPSQRWQSNSRSTVPGALAKKTGIYKAQMDLRVDLWNRPLIGRRLASSGRFGHRQSTPPTSRSHGVAVKQLPALSAFAAATDGRRPAAGAGVQADGRGTVRGPAAEARRRRLGQTRAVLSFCTVIDRHP